MEKTNKFAVPIVIRTTNDYLVSTEQSLGAEYVDATESKRQNITARLEIIHRLKLDLDRLVTEYNTQWPQRPTLILGTNQPHQTTEPAISDTKNLIRRFEALPRRANAHSLERFIGQFLSTARKLQAVEPTNELSDQASTQAIRAIDPDNPTLQ